MSYEIGIADNYKDLLVRLRDFISNPSRSDDSGSGITEIVPIDSDLESGEASQVWEVGESSGDIYSRWNDDLDGTGEYELIACGPGSGSDQIFVGIQTFMNVGGDYYNWRLQGFTGCALANTFDNQPGAISSYQPRMLMRNISMKYWFIVNGRRIIVVVNVDPGYYQACYLGFLLPYGSPSQLPYPLVIGGSANTSQNRFSENEAGNSIFVDPNGLTSSEATLKLLHGSWRNFYNASLGANVWPYVSRLTSVYSSGNSYDRFREIERNLDNSYPLFPLILMSNEATIQKNLWGELQGCFALPGAGLSAENEITVDGDTYIAFPNVYRTGTHNFWCVKKE